MMDKNNLVYSYISKNKITLGTTSQFIDLYNDNIDEIVIIDNIEEGIRMYPEDLNGSAYQCMPEDLLNKVNELIAAGIKAFIINSFAIDLNDVRDIYMPLIKQNNNEVIFCINNITESNIKHRVCVQISNRITDVSEEEWNENKYKIINDIEKSIERQSQDDYDNLNESNITKKEIFDFFNAALGAEESFDRFEFEEIKEKYSYTIDNNVLEISRTTDNDIIISDGQEAIKVSPKHFEFLTFTLSKLLLT